MTEERPHAPWSHRLKNGAPAGDPTSAPRCNARTRAGAPCRQPAMPNGRCRMHGGRSTGPTTQAGHASIAAARTTHGYYGADGRAFRAGVRKLHARAKLLTALARSPDANDPEKLRQFTEPVFPPPTRRPRRRTKPEPHAT